MSSTGSNDAAAGKRQSLQRLDSACDEFEEHWMSGSRPNIRDYLGRVEPQFQSRLFSELLLLDLEYASKQSVEIDQHELIDQYPEFASNIRKALAHSIATSQTSKFELDRTIEKTAIPDLETAEEPDAALPISCPGYELLGELARGGMGVVYRARQTEANRIVALKMILSGKLAGAAEVTRFKNEARAAANLDHPNIVPVFEIGEAGGQHYYSMGFVNGPSLKETIANDQLDERRSADLIRTVSLAVDYAHSRGIVHRDLKPANILLDEFGKPRITDFGLSKVLHGKADLTGTGQVLGTPAYMSPEQASGRTSQIGIATDIYSLGAILYELLTKRVPFKSKSVIGLLEKVRHESPPLPSSIMPRLSEDLVTVCMKCLEKKPEHRYASARALADDLDRFLVGDPIVARPISSGQRFVRWCRRRPVVVGLTACLVASMVVFGSTTIYFAATSKQTFSLVESERKQKDQNLEIALFAVEQMVEQAALLADVPRTEQKRVALLDQARQFYQRFIGQRPNDQDLKFESARVLRTVGNVFRILDSFDESKVAFDEAIEQLVRLRGDAPEDSRYIELLAKCRVDLCLLLRPLNYSLAFDEIEKAIVIYEDSFQATEPYRLAGFARALYIRGSLLSERGDLTASENDYLSAIEMLETMLHDDPQHSGENAQSDKVVLDLGKTLSLYGVLLQEVSRFEEAMSRYRHAIELLQPYATLRDHRQVSAVIRNQLAITLSDLDRRADAVDENANSIETLEDLARQSPRNGTFKSELANALLTRGRLMRDDGKLREARSFFDRADRLLQQLSVDFPGNQGYRNRIGNSHYELAFIDVLEEDFESSVKKLREAIVLHEVCYGVNPSNQRFAADLRRSYALMIRSLLELGDLVEMQHMMATCLRTFPQDSELHLQTAKWRATAAERIRAKDDFPLTAASRSEELPAQLIRETLLDLRRAFEIGESLDSVSDVVDMIKSFPSFANRDEFDRLLNDLRSK